MLTTVAAGVFYSSPTFLGWVGVLVAIVTLTVIAAQFRTSSKRRVLTYSLVSDTALLSEGVREKAGPDLRVTLGDDALSDPHVVSIRIGYKGSTDIRSADFDKSEPLVLKMGAPILKRLSQETDADKRPGFALDPDDNEALRIGPGIINNGQLISIDLLTDGHVNLRCPTSPLADVDIREAQAEDESELIWAKRLQAAAFTLFGVGVFGWFVADQAPFYFILAVFLFGVLGFASWIARAFTSARRHRGTLKPVNRSQPDKDTDSSSHDHQDIAERTS